MALVTPSGKVGLLVQLACTPERGAKVQFVSNGPWSSYHWRNLRRATAAEITAAGLDGVGCNSPPGIYKVRTTIIAHCDVVLTVNADTQEEAYEQARWLLPDAISAKGWRVKTALLPPVGVEAEARVSRPIGSRIKIDDNENG